MKTLSLACFGFLLTLAPLHATPLQGLTVAVSPDGKQVVAGGDTRTILVLDPASLEVTHREWIEVCVNGLAFNQTGDTLAVYDSSDEVILYSTEDWKKKAELGKRSSWTLCPEADLIAGYQGSTIYLHSLTDGSETGTIEIPEGVRVGLLGLNADGSQLALLEQGRTDDAEPKVSHSDIPKELKDLARDEFRQKNDGKTSQLFLFDTKTGEKRAEHSLFYSANNNAQLTFDGESVVVVAYDNVNAKISPKGEIKLFELPNSFNYGIGSSPKGDLLFTGGLRKFSITQAGPVTSVTGEADQIEGWPEYWKGFSSTPDGSKIYGATSAYRVFLLDASGEIAASAPTR